jgi:tetratricopeptide (TPR) repeat protein
MKWCIRGLICLFAATSLFAEKAPVSSDNALLWLSTGVLNPRFERALREQGLECRVTPEYAAVLKRAGADRKLIQKLQSSRLAKAPCATSTPAAKIAVLAHEKNYRAAEDRLRTLLPNDPRNPWLHFALGTVLKEQNRTEEAFDEFTESCRLTPGIAETHLQLAYLFYRLEDPENAIAEARTGLSMDPSNALGYRYLGLALYGDGQYDAALHAFEESLLRAPENADVYYDMGITLRDQGDWRRAAVAYRHVLNLRPNYWEAHSNLGVVLHDLGRLDEAIQEYRSARQLAPQEPSIRNNLGNTYCDKEEFDRAIAEFRELYRLHPEWTGGHNCLARAYMAKHDYPAAIRELEAAILVNPNGAAEHRVLGQALLLSGKDEQALHELHIAVELSPKSALAHHYLGTALVNTQQLEQAEKEFREALKLEPSAPNHYSLAACLMGLGRFGEALGELELASRMDPGQELYKKRMQEVARLISGSK